jgi:hypothetical protein
MVQRTRAEYAGRLAQEVRSRYLTTLQQTLDNNRNGELFELLFWQPGDDVGRYDDTDLRDKLDAFFKRNGELDKLLARYRLTGPESIEAELFTATPAPDEGDWGGVHRFLVQLADFLRAGDDKRGTVAGSRFSFTLVPEVSTTGSVWHVDSLDPAERKDWFYYPGDDSAAELQKAAVGPSLGKLKVSNWGFEVNRDDRALLLLWSRQSLRSAAVTDASRYWASFPGCLGPLLLAWSGTPLDDAELDEYVVPLVVTGTARRAPLRVLFERPLPARPPKP